MTAVIDDRTPNLSLPLPNVLNIQTADVARLRSMLGTLDTLLYNLQTTVSGLPTLTAVNAAIQAVVGAAPSALDTLKELADAIGDNANFAATMTTALAGKLPNVTATPTRLGGIKVGAGLTVGDDGTISVPASGGGTGLPAYSDLVMTATTNGQTVFAPSGGYSVGMIDVYHNGVLLVGNGEDYTASNGTSFTLVQGINNTTDILLVRRWAYVPASIAVNKNGDTLTGALNAATTVSVPSAATTPIGVAASNVLIVTGTTTITGFDTINAGAVRKVTFAGALTLTHNATSLILPGGANITTAAGDVAEFTSLGSGNWRCTQYQRADGSPLRGKASATGADAPQAQDVYKLGKLPWQIINAASTTLTSTALNAIQIVKYTGGTATIVMPTTPADGDVVGFWVSSGRTDTNVSVTNSIPIVSGSTSISDALIIDKVGRLVLLKYSSNLNQWSLAQ